MVNVLESTLEWALGEAIVNSCIGSHTPFSLDSASGLFLSRTLKDIMKNISDLIMFRRNLLLFATLGSLPKLESKGNSSGGNMSECHVISKELVQLRTSGFCKLVSQGSASFGVDFSKQSMCPNRDVPLTG
jgi:hypothetical protein